MNVQKSCWATSVAGVGGRIFISKMLNFYIKVFFVIGKALSGELSAVQTCLVLIIYYVCIVT